MLDTIISRTAAFLEEMPKSKRKKKGQFFYFKRNSNIYGGR